MIRPAGMAALGVMVSGSRYFFIEKTGFICVHLWLK